MIPALIPNIEVKRLIPNTSAEYSAPFIIIFEILIIGFINKTSPETVRIINIKISTALIFLYLLSLLVSRKASS